MKDAQLSTLFCFQSTLDQLCCVFLLYLTLFSNRTGVCISVAQRTVFTQSNALGTKNMICNSNLEASEENGVVKEAVGKKKNKNRDDAVDLWRSSRT
jgi:hypothetical protein